MSTHTCNNYTFDIRCKACDEERRAVMEMSRFQATKRTWGEGSVVRGLLPNLYRWRLGTWSPLTNSRPVDVSINGAVAGGSTMGEDDLRTGTYVVCDADDPLVPTGWRTKTNKAEGAAIVDATMKQGMARLGDNLTRDVMFAGTPTVNTSEGPMRLITDHPMYRFGVNLGGDCSEKKAVVCTPPVPLTARLHALRDAVAEAINHAEAAERFEAQGEAQAAAKAWGKATGAINPMEMARSVGIVSDMELRKAKSVAKGPARDFIAQLARSTAAREHANRINAPPLGDWPDETDCLTVDVRTGK